ncbi:GNAT family N-acetyltransferase [Clostridium cylindrosporum]|uniref:Acetyltransferase family protein n=1 Tax=Clostridium cylindrosporum DSM 605 TaxID=1121307 RepID=A0A0J8DG66_CLOCY|nr:GNAT family N-acetyltransferase [Clostridium cylindrosporum]KMT23163.1 acetyltransferase family protein [Clostridium cylindrosporum DSM 605]
MKFEIKHFSDLTSSEVYSIARVRANVFILEQNILDEEDLDGIDLDAYHVFLKDEDIIAYCRILKPGAAYKDASIGRVLVAKEHRKKGIAEKMMIEAVKFIFEEMNENSITISAQEYVSRLYESIGFVKIGEVYDEVGIPHIKMTLVK